MTVRNDLREIAPKFGLAVAQALNLCWRRGLDPIVFEALRDEATQKAYFERGVSHAQHALSSWHGYGLAVDVISRAHGWNAPESWWTQVASVFKECGLDWGGDWHSIVDKPHFQWGTLKPSPSPRARELYDAQGLIAVWREVGAA